MAGEEKEGGGEERGMLKVARGKFILSHLAMIRSGLTASFSE